MVPSMKLTFVTFLVSFYMFSCVTSTEFEVGGNDGWNVPKSTSGDVFNKWASQNRFKVGDTIRFKYNRDTVLEVTEEEYNKCKATSHPLFYSNNGDTVYTLDRPGFFYFITGVSGHCEKGQKMIIKVMETESQPESPPPSSSTPSPSTPSSSSSPPSSSLPASTHKKSNAFKTAARFSSSGFVLLAVFVVSVFSLV